MRERISSMIILGILISIPTLLSADNQGSFVNGDSIQIEYDTNPVRLLEHRDRILANDPLANVILKLFDRYGNYTIIP